MHKPVLMHADIDEGPELGDVRHHAFQLHPGREIRELLHSLGKLRGLELRTRIPPRLFELAQNVPHGGKPKPLVNELHGMQPCEHRVIADELLHGKARLCQNPLHHAIAFRVHGGSIKRFSPVRDPQEPRRKLKRLGADMRHVQKIPSFCKSALLVPILYDRARLQARKAGDPRKERPRCSIEIHTHRVHAVFHHGIQFAGEFHLIHIVLVLADADRLGIDLHEFRERILQTPCDRDGSAVADIKIREFLCGSL